MADFVDKISDAANGTWDDLSDPETWTKIQEAINEAGGDALEWSEEAWILTQARVDCLKNATNTDLTQNTTQGIWDCRTQLGEDEFNNITVGQILRTKSRKPLRALGTTSVILRHGTRYRRRSTKLAGTH